MEVLVNPKELLNISQAAGLLGVAGKTVYEIIERGELHPIQIADRQYLDRSEVLRLKEKRNNA